MLFYLMTRNWRVKHDCWWLANKPFYYRLSNFSIIKGCGFFEYSKKITTDFFTVSLWRRIDDPPIPHGLLRYHKKYGALHIYNLMSKEVQDNEYLELTALQLELMKRLWMDQLRRFKKLHKIKYDQRTNMPMRLLNRKGDAEPDPRLTALADNLRKNRLQTGLATVSKGGEGEV